MKYFFKIMLVFVLMLYAPMAQAKILKFIQVTDLHYNATPSSDKAFHQLIEDINKTPDLDFVVFTGDNIDHPSLNELKSFLHLAKKIHVPTYYQIGNHECTRSALTKELALKEFQKNVHYKMKSFNYIIKKGNIILLFADGAKEIVPLNGYFRPETLSWIDKTLTKYKNKTVLIFQHFPLVELRKSSTLNLYKRNDYIDMLAKHNNVKAIFTGHMHTVHETNLGSATHYITGAASGSNPCYRLVILRAIGKNKYDIFSQMIEI